MDTHLRCGLLPAVAERQQAPPGLEDSLTVPGCDSVVREDDCSRNTAVAILAAS